MKLLTALMFVLLVSLPAFAQEYAPLPEAASGVAIDPEKGYLVEEIGDGLYWITEGTYQTIFLTTGEGVIVVDAPPSIGANILSAIAEVTDEPITHVVYSHSHADHIGAATIYPEEALIIAHEETAALLERSNDPNRPLPDITFDDRSALNVGSQHLELEYRGVNHEPGNIFIYAPAQQVLMLVDVVFPGWTPFPRLALAEDANGFIAAHDEILSFEFDVFVGGHLTRLGTREDVEIQKEYIMDIVQAAGEANAAMDIGAAFAEAAERGAPFNTWAGIQIAFDGVAEDCAEAVIPNWVDRLGGVDIFTFDHCWSISESQRID